MVRTRHLIIFIPIFVLSNNLYSTEGVDCGIEYEEWAECIFMKEGRQLTMTEQSLLRKAKYDIERTVNDAKQLVDHWESGLKSSGPTPEQVAMIPEVVSGLVDAGQAAGSIVADTVMNDPLKQHEWKSAEFQATCMLYYKEPCLVVKDLIDISDTAVRGISEAKNKLNAILDNPSLVLGEEWGDFEKDINEIRSNYKSAESTTHNLSQKVLEQRYKKYFKSYEAQLQVPGYSRTKWENETSEASRVMADSIRDTLVAAKAQYGRMAETKGADLSDLDSIKKLNDKLPLQVGRMQAYEQLNMRKIQSIDSWRMIQESYLSQTDLFALDMAEEERGESTHEAALTNFLKRKNTTVIDDGQGYR